MNGVPQQDQAKPIAVPSFRQRVLEAVVSDILAAAVIAAAVTAITYVARTDQTTLWTILILALTAIVPGLLLTLVVTVPLWWTQNYLFSNSGTTDHRWLNCQRIALAIATGVAAVANVLMVRWYILNW
jgi:hypothetical protein